MLLLCSAPAVALGTPASPPGAAPLAEAIVAAPKAPLPRGSERVLVVDDEPGVRDCLVQQLLSPGYAVSQASDSTAGLSAFETAAAPYDLLLTDLMIPGPLNGRALADVIGARWPGTKIVFMSGHAQHALLSADALVLNKPFRKVLLAETVRQALGAP